MLRRQVGTQLWWSLWLFPENWLPWTGQTNFEKVISCKAFFVDFSPLYFPCKQLLHIENDLPTTSSIAFSSLHSLMILFAFVRRRCSSSKKPSTYLTNLIIIKWLQCNKTDWIPMEWAAMQWVFTLPNGNVVLIQHQWVFLTSSLCCVIISSKPSITQSAFSCLDVSLL